MLYIHCCITKNQKDVSHNNVLFPLCLSFTYGKRQFRSYLHDEKQIVVCVKKKAHKAVV